MGEQPVTVNCRGSAHITPGIEDVTTMCLVFAKQQTAIIHSSWLDPRKVREMTIVGSKRMIVYDDVVPLEKIRIFDARVETPPHYDTFAEFHYAYHYGDMYVPYINKRSRSKLSASISWIPSEIERPPCPMAGKVCNWSRFWRLPRNP